MYAVEYGMLCAVVCTEFVESAYRHKVPNCTIKIINELSPSNLPPFESHSGSNIPYARQLMKLSCVRPHSNLQ